MDARELIIRKAELEFEEAQAAAEQAQAAYVAAQARLVEMRAVRDWLQSYGQASATADPPSPSLRFGKPIPEVPQTQLCTEALEKIGSPANAVDVRDRLGRDGHDLTLLQIRSTLKHLAKKESSPVVSVKPGLWTLQRTPRLPALANAPAPSLNGAARSAMT